MKMGNAMIVASTLLVTALSMGRVGAVAADDETDDTSNTIQATIDAVSCASTPQTITVLGINVDITAAIFNGGSATSCATLQVGRTADLRLINDVAPLVAATLSTSGGGNVQLQGAIQAIDGVAQTVQILGVTISTVGAEVDGADDDSGDGTTQAIDPTQLIVGQFVNVELDEGQLPSFVAKKLEMKNFTNQVDVEVDDSNGNPIDDVSDDISVAADDTTVVTTPAGTNTKRKVVHLHTSAKGSFTLSGLPTGRAKVTVKRVVNGKSHKKTARVDVLGNSAAPVKIKLRTN